MPVTSKTLRMHGDLQVEALNFDDGATWYQITMRGWQRFAGWISRDGHSTFKWVGNPLIKLRTLPKPR